MGGGFYSIDQNAWDLSKSVKLSFRFIVSVLGPFMVFTYFFLFWLYCLIQCSDLVAEYNFGKICLSDNQNLYNVIIGFKYLYDLIELH